MNFGFGMNLVRLVDGAAVFHPTDLSGLKAWYDLSDLSTLFQASAMTIPVTSDGDPVGAILDKSGLGNHILQETSSSRPTYRKEAGVNRLEFDGVDDFLLFDGSLLVGTNYTFAAAWSQPTALNSAAMFGRSQAVANTNLHFGTRDASTFTHAHWANDLNVSFSAAETPFTLVGTLGDTGRDLTNSAQLTEFSSAAFGRRSGLYSNSNSNLNFYGAGIYTRKISATERAQINTYLEALIN